MCGGEDKVNKGTFLRLLRFTQPYWPRYALALLGVGGTALIEVGKASFFKYIFDGMSQRSWHLIHTALWLAFGLFIAESVTNFTKTYMVETASNKVIMDLRSSLFTKIQSLPLKFFEKNHSGDVISRFINDLNSTQNVVGWQLLSLIENPLSALVAFIYLTTLDLKLALFCLMVGPTTVLSGKMFGGALRRNAEKTQVKVSEILILLSDVLTSIPVIKSFQMEEKLSHKFLATLKELYSLNRRNTIINASLGGSANAIGLVSIVLTFAIASYRVMHNQMSIGTVLAFTQLMNRLTWPFSGLAGLWGSLQSAMASADRVFAILDEPDENIENLIQSQASLNRHTGKSLTAIELDNVTFGYDESQPVLVDVNLKVLKGETLALVGPSGSGKSSLIKLLLGFYKPTKGDIKIDGISSRDLGLKQLRALSSFVPQETILVSGTIEDNIRCGNPFASTEDIQRIAMAANAYDFIMEFSDGFQTVVGERGAKLSGGQRQRIAIARALLKNPNILLLDEATSALDAESEFLVQEALNELIRGRTCVVVAHRLSTIRKADRIAVLDGGRIIELGSHHELLNLGGLYASMYNRQFINDGGALA